MHGAEDAKPAVPRAVRVAETVLYDASGDGVLWIFTSKDGVVMRRDRKRLKLETVVETMHAHALAVVCDGRGHSSGGEVGLAARSSGSLFRSDGNQI